MGQQRREGGGPVAHGAAREEGKGELRAPPFAAGAARGAFAAACVRDCRAEPWKAAGRKFFSRRAFSADRSAGERSDRNFAGGEWRVAPATASADAHAWSP
eukprot:357961-Chlamydomonas_euryale.AAC.7